ncbi:hypothetical protein Q9233_005026 [Columba guinea]|nr:hypothetical protein Q9233_005026 [Columba guinea]
MSKNTNFRHHKMGGHDAEELKNFWEKVIEKQTKQREGEECRLSKSALNKSIRFDNLVMATHISAAYAYSMPVQQWNKIQEKLA